MRQTMKTLALLLFMVFINSTQARSDETLEQGHKNTLMPQEYIHNFNFTIEPLNILLGSVGGSIVIGQTSVANPLLLFTYS
jgi:hypothetical protein